MFLKSLKVYLNMAVQTPKFFLEKEHKKVNLQFTDMIAGFFMRQQYH